MLNDRKEKAAKDLVKYMAEQNIKHPICPNCGRRETERISTLAVLFSHYPEFDFDKGIFYPDLVTAWWDLNDLSHFVEALRGTFSGSVMQYYRKNKHLFDDVHEHAGLLQVATDLCPFTKFQGYEDETYTLEKFAEMLPENSNTQHLIFVRDSIPQFTIANTDVYYLSNALFQDLKAIDFDKIRRIQKVS